MDDTSRIVLIALGIALLVVVIVPLLIMTGMMAGMMDGMSDMDGMSSGAWAAVLLVLLGLIAGGVMLAVGLRDRS